MINELFTIGYSPHTLESFLRVLKKHQITPKMIEAKREQLLFYRELKTLKQEVQQYGVK